MKHKLLLIEFIILFFVITTHVSASYIGDTTGFNLGETGSGGVGSCSGGECAKGYEGYRISLIQTDGTILSVKNYFFMDGSNPTRYKNWIGWNNGRCNKVSYLKGIPECSNMTAGDNFSNSITKFSRSQLVKKWKFAVPSDGNVHRYWNIPGLISLFETHTKAEDFEPIYQEVFEGRISTDPTNSNYKTAEEMADYWIVIEPLYMVAVYNTNYYGTPYELANLYHTSKTAWVIDRILPCASVVTGTIANRSDIVPEVSSGAYFGGSLNFVDLNTSATNTGSSLNTFCTTKDGSNLDSKYLTGNYGTGMGLIWVGDLVEQQSCSDVENNYKRANLKGMTLDSLNRLPNEMSYNKDGQEYKFTKEWYINQCSCYGVMDYYKSKTGGNLGNLNLNLLNTVFSEKKGLFEEYANKVKSDDSKLETTPWTYNKYISRNCPYTASCEKVSFKGIKASVMNNNYWWWPTYTTKDCSQLPLFGNSSYTSSYINKNKDTYVACFKEYNKINNTNWNLDNYTAGCPIEGTTGYDCTPQYNVGKCISGDDISYTDSANSLTEEEYWNNCVFNNNGFYSIDLHKESNLSSTGSLSYFDSSLGDGKKVSSERYCEVYCVEDIVTNFDRSVSNVKAGRYFNWNYHEVSGSRTCKTKFINWDKYESDIDIANKEIVNSYAEWQLAIKAQENIKNHSTVTNSSSCGCVNNTAHNSCCTSETKVKIPQVCRGSCSTYNEDGSCKWYNVFDCSTYSYPCVEPDNTRYNLYSSAPTSFTVRNTDYGNITKYYSGESWCSGSRYTPNAGVSAKYNAYINNINIAQGYTNRMKTCYEWEASNVYNLRPTADISYSDGYYSYTGQLTSTIVDDEIVKDESNCKNINVLNYTECSGTNCIKLGTMKQCESFEETKSSTAVLSINENIYRYISKFDNTAYCGIGTTGCNKTLTKFDSTKYITYNNSSLPVAYSTKDGTYDTLSLRYNNLGHMKLGSTDVDTILGDIDNDYTKWNCEFSVTSQLITNDTKEGINLIYRPIDLNNPFPDMDGSGRNTGSNWCSGNDCRNTNDTVSEYITKNRNVTTDEIYNTEPMYTFVLTPTIINEIRSYNDLKGNDYAKYTVSESGNEKIIEDGKKKTKSQTDLYDFKCNDNTGRTCISDYLSYLIEITGAKNNPGTCVNDQSRTYNNPTAFENCRDTN